MNGSVAPAFIHNWRFIPRIWRIDHTQLWFLCWNPFDRFSSRPFLSCWRDPSMAWICWSCTRSHTSSWIAWIEWKRCSTITSITDIPLITFSQIFAVCAPSLTSLHHFLGIKNSVLHLYLTFIVQSLIFKDVSNQKMSSNKLHCSITPINRDSSKQVQHSQKTARHGIRVPE